MDESTMGDLVAWCREREGWTVTEREGGLSATAGERTVEVSVGPDRVTLESRVALPADVVAGAAPGFSLDDAVAGLVESRPALVSGGAEGAGDGRAVVLRSTVHGDGLSKQAFSVALDELVRSRGLVERFVADIRGQQALLAELQLPARTDQPAAEPAVAPIPVATVSQPAAQPQPTQPQPVAAPVTPAQPAAAPPTPSWGATHAVAATPARAWAAPDPSQPPVAELAPRTEVRVLERRGDWARVDASNGWSGWVDARLLVSVG
jgi:hypothetical protein